MKHTNDKNLAREIALDHLYELKDYYDKLSKIEEKTDYSKEKESGLHGWFSRRGGEGSKGWVDCNTCRKDSEVKTKCKPCGREKGEERSKYPACRPTPSACKTKGKGEEWGKKSESINEFFSFHRKNEESEISDDKLSKIRELIKKYGFGIDNEFIVNTNDYIEYYFDVSSTKYEGRDIDIRKKVEEIANILNLNYGFDLNRDNLFYFFNDEENKESINEVEQSEIDRILDKISEFGFNSLTKSEMLTLDNVQNKNFNTRDFLIEKIKEIVSNEGMITSSDLMLDTNPVYKEENQEIHLIERFYSDSVGVVIYGGYKYETEIGEYKVPYEKLNDDLINEIYEILIESDFINENSIKVSTEDLKDQKTSDAVKDLIKNKVPVELTEDLSTVNSKRELDFNPTTFSIEDVSTAMDIVKEYETFLTDKTKKTILWYNDKLINKIINYGVKMGWLFRPSVTQVHWTEKGINELNSGEELVEGKKDRCYNIAKRKYNVFPSAYASGAIVRCRKGEIWKNESKEKLKKQIKEMVEKELRPTITKKEFIDFVINS